MTRVGSQRHSKKIIIIIIIIINCITSIKVFIITHLKQIMSVGYRVLHLFCD